MQVKYSTLILDVPKGEPKLARTDTRPAGSQPAESGPATREGMASEASAKEGTTQPSGQQSADLAGPDRQLYAAITSRDLFRPYVKRPPEPPPPAPAAEKPPENPPPQEKHEDRGPPEQRFRVVGLPSWHGKQDVAVLDTENHQTATYKPGDALAGGTIVGVDYRPLPLPDKPDKVSSSRVIIKLGPEYWAVELGRTLAEKYRIAPDRLPAELKGEPAATAPAPEGG